ncbi:MAG: hypothetical protein AB7Q29_06325 [Vicinamibacterales bacterium]
MANILSARLYAYLLVALALTAAPAYAQFTPRSLSDPATGERYHIEGEVNLWAPGADAVISSVGLGIPGTNINLKNDLGLTDQRMSDVRLVLRPFKKHKLRFQYTPIQYQQQADLVRDVVFQGQLYRVGLPVNSSLDWKAYRFSYEYDFLYHDRWFAGVLLDAKYTDVFASLRSPVNYETIHARAPIPTIGGIGRYYVVPNISITAELSGFKIPDSVAKDVEVQAHYLEFDMYGTVNFTNNFGAKLGYRAVDVLVVPTNDRYSFQLKGLYFGGVARF